MPERLLERIWPVAARAPWAEGQLVLYWMHHAVRGHDNLALDVALSCADELGLPLLVYQGLAGAHRFNADRHHAFILEGARDAHAELAGRGIRAVFHLPSDPRAPSPLRELVSRAALVVTEDFPAPPFPAWTRRLASRTQAPVWAVDSCCILPMRRQPKAFARAFQFGRHNQQAYAERVPWVWPEIERLPAVFEGVLPFAPVNLDRADLSSLIAACEIDHSLPAIAHTPGGSEAGYRRWEQFRREGLASYHQRRNDAAECWPLGVSRLSPYLHHGQVSPFRIAREAWESGGAGAEKFLDELLIWRELAHNLCVFSPNPESLSVLPDWARQTLAEHADDPRERLIDLETLSRAQSGDRLWDLAQTSLLVQGELHNNLRMTWAKAIPHWRGSPERALEALIDLNHRYALDGCDPSSYGGLLWTLGLFDRPFEPERPVTGRLRERSTAAHARRLDLDAYRQRVTAPANGRRLRIAVIGAGLSGLAAARALADQRHQVSLFEKSRGCGGRAATRRAVRPDGQTLGFDHGAQYFTARDPRFQRRLHAWAERGLVAPWDARIGAFDGVEIAPAGQDATRWVGVPRMNALGRALAEGLELRLETRVLPPRWCRGRWQLGDEAGQDLGRFDRVVVSAPAPQSAELLMDAPELAAQAACVEYTACWTLMLEFDAPVPLAFDGIFVNQGPLRWVARDCSKPGRLAPAEDGESWVLHAQPGWTRKHLNDNREQVEAAMIDAFALLAPAPLPTVSWRQSHSWLYSLVESPLESGCLWDPSLGIGACGDWCNGARIEGAWLSGEALAGRILATKP
ncbi:NAD(P)-binding protein [Halochromatium sp.]